MLVPHHCDDLTIAARTTLMVLNKSAKISAA
jgi:hypothetical protein